MLHALLAATAVAGGVALLTGWISLDWLRGSPFRTYAIPGVILALIVGGSATVATALLLIQHALGVPAVGFSEAVILGFKIVEVLVVGSQPGLMRNVQVLSFMLGLVIVLLATWLWAAEHTERQRHAQTT